MKSKRLLKSFVYASKGFSAAFRSQFNMRFHFVMAIVVMIASILLRVSAVEWCIILLCIGSVLSAELLNTSIELNVDLTMPEQNEKAGQSKDIAAAAVFVVSIMSVIIGGIIFIPKLVKYF